MNGLLATIGERVEELRDMGVALRESVIHISAEVMALDTGGFIRLERCRACAKWRKPMPTVDIMVALMQAGFLVSVHKRHMDVHWMRVSKL